MLTAGADQIRRLIRIIDLDNPRINYVWLGEWLTGYRQTMLFADGDTSESEPATPEVVLDLFEGIAGLRKIFTK